MSTLDRIRGQVRRDLRGWEGPLAGAISTREGEDTARLVLAEVRERVDAMLPTVPDPGFAAPHMRRFTIGGLIYVAVYLALKERGYDAPRAWEVCEEATRTYFEAMRGLERRAAKDGLSSAPMRALTRWLAGRSQRAPVGGWVFDYVELEGGDYGVDYRRCAIRELAIAHGAAAFAPYVCLADITGSTLFGWGLTRTETLAQGGARCDFRFRRGGETDVRVRLPVLP